MRMKSGRRVLRPFLLPVGAFALCIVAGALMLMLPACRREPLSMVDALFVSTSAVCVTGLSPIDVFSVFNRAGQWIILALMELGGLGIITFATLVTVLVGRRVPLNDRLAVEQSLFYNPRLSLSAFVRRVVVMVFAIEGAGALLLLVFCPERIGWFDALFVAVSSFCNAGFAPWADNLAGFRGDVGVNLVIMALIIFGGLGFFVLDELWSKASSLARGRPGRELSFYSRLVLGTSFWLVFLGAAAIFALASFNPRLSGLPSGERFLAALFESVSSRTAGFASVDQSLFSTASLYLVVFLMLIGGSPCSCAGGLKTTTFRIIGAFLLARFRGSGQTVTMGRAFDGPTVSRALLLLALSVHFVFAGSFAILMFEQGATPHASARPFFDIFFEAVSAFCTVGLSVNLTPCLGDASKLTLCVLMFAGRLGPIWLVGAVQSLQRPAPFRYPEENVPVG